MHEQTTKPTRKPPAPEGDPRRYQFVKRPRCPYCHSVRVRCEGTLDTGDASTVVRYTYCTDCGHTHYVVAE